MDKMNQIVDSGVVGDPEARRASGDLMNGNEISIVDQQKPNPEVLERKQKRYRSGPEKLRILQEIDAAPSEKGAIIRRERIYASYVSRWRKERENGTLLGLSDKRRGRKQDLAKQEKIRIAQLEKQVARQQKELKKCHIIIDVQKKVSEMLGIEQDPKLTENVEL